MRAMWKGSVSFGLVNVPVSLYTATQNHDIRFHQVHAPDGGRIRYRRVCELENEPVEYSEIAKGYEHGSELVILTDEDFENLPLSSNKEIEVREFVDVDEVDPLLLDRSYYLEPDARAVKPYVLLREALENTDRVAIVTVALRQRESLALLRVRGKAIVLQTMLWPDEVREADFEVLDTEVEPKASERKMADSLVESMVAEFDPGEYEDGYATAVRELVDAKLEGQEFMVRDTEAGDDGGEVIDLMAALRESVDSAKKGRKRAGSKPESRKEDGASKNAAAAGDDKGGAARKSTAKKSTAKKGGAKKSTAKKGGAKKSTAKKGGAAEKSTAKGDAAKKGATRKSAAKKSA